MFIFGKGDRGRHLGDKLLGIWACGGIDKSQKYQEHLQLSGGLQPSLCFWDVPQGKVKV